MMCFLNPKTLKGCSHQFHEVFCSMEPIILWYCIQSLQCYLGCRCSDRWIECTIHAYESSVGMVLVFSAAIEKSNPRKLSQHALQ